MFKPRETNSTSGTVTYVWSGLVWGEIIFRSLLDVVDGLDRARRSGARLRLVLIGGGVWMPALILAIERRWPQLDVKFEGWVSPDKMPGLLREMDVGLMPMAYNKNSSEWIESKSPTKMFEFMAAALPVIGERRGEVEHILTHGEDGLLFDSPDDIAEAALVLDDPEKRRRMGAAAREKVEQKYSLKALADPLMEAIVGNG